MEGKVCLFHPEMYLFITFTGFDLLTRVQLVSGKHQLQLHSIRLVLVPRAPAPPALTLPSQAGLSTLPEMR